MNFIIFAVDDIIMEEPDKDRRLYFNKSTRVDIWKEAMREPV